MTTPTQSTIASEDTCYHCGLAIPGGVIHEEVVDNQRHRFCCTGCHAAFQMIRGAGLDHFYDRRDGFTDRPDDARVNSLSAFDDPAFQEKYVQTNAAGQQEVHLLLDGIHCAACVWVNEKILQQTPGVAEARVNFSTHRAHVVWDGDKAALSTLIGAVRRIGYDAEPYDVHAVEARYRRFDRDMLTRLGVGGFGAGNIMLIAVALYAGYFQGIQSQYKDYFHWVSLILATPVVFYSGWPFMRGAFNGLRMRHLNMDLPIALGALVTYFYSVAVTVRGVGEVYFDSVATFVFVLLVGRYFESAARRKAAGATERLLSLEPQTAVVIRDGKEQTIPVRQVAVGDHVVIRPGDTFPVDGVIIQGSTTVNSAMLTGESLPVLCGEGERVSGGTSNVDGSVIVEAQRVGAETTLARIVRLVERAQSERPPIQTLADRVAARFVGVILVLAAATLSYWLWRDPAQALENTVALLIITCPCALGLATPAAMIVATGNAARQGVLIRSGEVLERLARITRVVMDKTGTLTQGMPEVVVIHPMAGQSESVLLATIAGVERHSEHPLARAVVSLANARKIEPEDMDGQLKNYPGRGVVLRMEGGVVYRVGRAEFVGVQDWQAQVPKHEGHLTWIWCRRDDTIMGVIGLMDQLKIDAAETVQHLKKNGLPVSLLSGDRQDVVSYIGQQAGVEQAIGDALPDEKAEAISLLQGQGQRVAMIGDGINDAPALARADLSMVVEQASDVSVATADVVMLNQNLKSIVTLFSLAEKTMHIIRQNFLFSILYNAIAIPLAMSGHVLPIVAAIAMPLSSLTVVGNAMRLRNIDSKQRDVE
ncbi:MAG: heavy metal translocating P-type ATPase [Magnetococcales bacterium]|nr:heavy metal translocating P-type ATPase [Magnetococcales bacterium]